jgi:hypothetical protein
LSTLTQTRRNRIAEIEKEIQTLMAEKKEKLAQGKSVDEIDQKQEELERQKDQLVEALQDTWSS